ncbi:hypothetical protein EG328_007162 [Venturia inaequalis]|uniref:Pyoverdine biosynthesis n=1 Tax=Venturia inaequalis TaxID=5025 RepID=A0A8H3YTT2_VENIN|nr:hypothetical protein EG328_007162 [Venturia inaequalis]
MTSVIPTHIPLPWAKFLHSALESDTESLQTELLSMTKTRSAPHSAGPNTRAVFYSDRNEIPVLSQTTAVEDTRIEGVEVEDDSESTSSSSVSTVSKHSIDTEQTTEDDEPSFSIASKLQGTKTSVDIAGKIIDVLERYGQHIRTESESSNDVAWTGRAKFLPIVLKQVQNGQTIDMILPSFPWKSINRVDKVIGHLPDLGEELALARLHAICTDIQEVYEPGAMISITTDGLLFDDIVGISDQDTWEYSEELLKMAANHGYKGIKLLRAMDILGLTAGKPMTRELYMELAPVTRKAILEQYGRTEEEIRKLIIDDFDSNMTYRGFIRFLESDLRYSPVAKDAKSGHKYRKIAKAVAGRMMIRAESFTKLLQAECKDYVRLSIHPSTGAAKLSVPLIKQENGQFPRSPWHCCIAVAVDGTYRTVHSKDVRESHRLVYQDGRPYFYREKSALWDWEADDVEFRPLYPRGLLVSPVDTSKGRTLTNGELEKLNQLSRLQPIRAINFANGDLVF